MAEVRIENLSKRFGDIQAVHDLSLTVPSGEFLVLLGSSGAGKSTTLRLIAGLEKADRGAVFLGGQDATGWHPAQRELAFVFQQFSLYPHLTVFDNLAFPLRAPGRKLAPAEIARRIHEVAGMLHIEHKLSNKATKLSGGEMQRVAIGRALVREPKVLLMDEPMSSLDAKLREELRGELKRIQVKLGATIVYVTHDQVEATTLADRIGVLEAGRLVQVAAPREVYDDPSSLRVAQRLGSPPINVLAPSWCVPGEVPPGASTLAIRPEDVQLERETPAAPSHYPQERCTSCTVKGIERLGAQIQVLLHSPHGELRALATPGSGLARGHEVYTTLPHNKRLFFNLSGERIRT